MATGVYLGTFLAVLSTVVTPVPEETALLAAGWLARRTGASLVGVAACAWLATLIGDTGTFALGRGLLQRVLGGARLGRIVPAHWRGWADEQVARHGWRAILIGRFLVGLRGFLYFALGGSRYPFGRFLAINAAVGTMEVALIVAVGYAVGEPRPMRGRVALIDAVVIVTVVAASFVLPWIVRRRYATRLEPGHDRSQRGS